MWLIINQYNFMNFNLGDFLLGLLTLCGALGVFLYGMKLMSEALQKVAGNKMRTILAAVTKNKFVGIITGLFITAVIQSSAATIVMVVSFVNAGLLNLVQAFSVIMGANIGTTATAWIISLLGFSVNVSALAVPIIAFALPLLFSGNNTRRYYGELIFGFALLFMGLGMLKAAVPPIDQHPEALAFLQNFSDPNHWNILLFMAVGAILTIIVQSSSVTVAITLVMCANGWIPEYLACAMVLGENIGSTITANLAAIGSNLQARRAAFSHTVFNIIGVIWAFLAFNWLYKGVVYLGDLWGPSDQAASVAFNISLFHTVFNILNVLFLSWFSKYIVLVVEKVIRPKKKDASDDEVFQLAYINTGMLSTAELSLLQAHKEIVIYGERTHKMFTQVRDLLVENEVNEFAKRYSRIEKYENISDRMEVEIANYLMSVGTGRLSAESKRQLQMKMRMASEIESIGDSCYNIARILQRQRGQEVDFPEHITQQIQSMFELTDRAMTRMISNLKDETLQTAEIHKTQNLENEINNLRNQLKMQNLKDVSDGKYPYVASTYYMDIIVECEKIGDYIVNVVEAEADTKLSQN